MGIGCWICHLGGVIGCKEKDDEEGGAIVEGTVLIGWENPKGTIKIPDGVTVIGEYALSNASEVTGVVMPSSVLTIESSAFRKCTSLKNVELGNSLTTIKEWAFQSCTSLTDITIPDSVTFINTYAFADCDNLKSVSVTGEWNNVGTLTAEALRTCNSGWNGHFERK